MSEPATLRAFVDGAPVDVPRGATLLDAVRAADPALADAVEAGTRAVADSRGLAVPSDTLVSGGAVLRVVSSRAPRAPGPMRTPEILAGPAHERDGAGPA
ncbi:MAG: hypothetical protein IT356_07995 [Gemmatimonadaceae bacterium]|nr:hypothetical protein [Gemmatimonadaceae bacterium]